MMDLFSTFNPITSTYLSMNWIMILAPIMYVPSLFWTINSKYLMVTKMILESIISQFKPSLSKINRPNLIIVVATMFTIMTVNMTSLLPNTFSPTAHIMINMAMAFPLWWALLKKKLLNFPKLLSNLTPSNTPPLLIPFMVVIELVSFLIQPITLSVRLTANITAGHIMMVLISQMYQIFTLSTLVTNMMMLILELGVSMIQAYVFAMLIIMYSK